jgi:hypothetical protein
MMDLETAQQLFQTFDSMGDRASIANHLSSLLACSGPLGRRKSSMRAPAAASLAGGGVSVGGGGGGSCVGGGDGGDVSVGGGGGGGGGGSESWAGAGERGQDESKNVNENKKQEDDENESDHAVGGESKEDERVRLCSVISETLAHTAKFVPLVKWRWARRLAHHRWAEIAIIACSLLLLANYFIGYFPLHLGLFVFACTFVAPIEFTRFDRNLLKLVVRRFEFWMMVISVVSHTVFAMASTFLIDNTRDPSKTEDLGLSIINVAIYLILYLGLCAMDAAPAYPVRFKVLFTVAAILNMCIQINLMLVSFKEHRTFCVASSSFCTVFSEVAIYTAIDVILWMVKVF